MRTVHENVRRRPGLPATAALVLGLVALLLVLPEPAGAALARTGSPCTPVKLGNRAAVVAKADHADAVFAAKVVRVGRIRMGGSSGKGGVVEPKAVAWSHVVRVVSAFQGTARKGGTARIILTPTGARPGKKLAVGATYVFFAEQQGDHFTVARCGGSVRLAKGMTQALAAKLQADLQQPETEGVEVHLSTPSGGVRDLPRLGTLVAPGAGLALLGVLGLLLVGRLARERG